MSRLTNDLSDYAGVSLTADHGSLVTGRSDGRVGIWVDDGSGHGSVPLVSPVSFSGPIDLAHVAWAADHLLHTITANSHVSIATRIPGQADEGIVATGANPAATSDGRTIVFVGIGADNRIGLWKADDDGRHTPQH